MYLIYALILIFASFIIWQLFEFIVGVGLPIETTAYSHLAQMLKKAELSKFVPSACVAECVDDSIKFARSIANPDKKGRGYIRSETIKQNEVYASYINAWIHGSEQFDERTSNRYREIFERHKIPRLNSKFMRQANRDTNIIFAPVDSILMSFIPVLWERCIPNYGDAALQMGEKRLSANEIKAVLLASGFIGAEAAAGIQNLDRYTVERGLNASINQSDLFNDVKHDAQTLIGKFYSSGTIRADHGFDDWICETFWETYQDIPYTYPSAMSSLVSYGLTIKDSLAKCRIILSSSD